MTNSAIIVAYYISTIIIALHNRNDGYRILVSTSPSAGRISIIITSNDIIMTPKAPPKTSIAPSARRSETHCVYIRTSMSQGKGLPCIIIMDISSSSIGSIIYYSGGGWTLLLFVPLQ